MVENDSPIIRELRRTSDTLFIYLLVFGAAVSCRVAACLIWWVREPLRIISTNLETQNPSGLEPLSRRRDEFGNLANLILRFRRTEERLQKVEDALRHSQKLEALGRLAGGVAHDFNNLLTAIIGYSELLESEPSADGHSVEYARLIHKAGDQAASLTRQLLAFSRKQLLQPRVLDLNTLVLDMEKLLRRIIGESVSIFIRPNAAEARVLADPGQLEQVVINLGVNARDAMPQGGALFIETSNVTTTQDNLPAGAGELAPGEYVRLTVTDTGSGIDHDTLSRIFDPFFTTKEPGRGTGLGLATVYGIVKQSRGTILVNSEPGAGSSFIILLPRMDAPVQHDEPRLPSILENNSSRTILVVEDDEIVRKLVCDVLGEAGYNVFCAAIPSAALEIVRNAHEPIHLLITDVVMPEMHGPALAEVLRPLMPEMRVLYMSGYSENDISDQGVIHPDLDVLQKPFTVEALIRKIREVFEERSATGITWTPGHP
jgi:signal transduction histidine kinase/CheY-like chemotaxis protein